MRVLVAVWLLGLPVLTRARVAVWHSEQSIWEDAVKKAPEKARPIMNLGRAHELAGDEVLADAAYRRAISLSFDPRRTEYDRNFTQAAAETNLAHIAMKHGQLASAITILDMTLRHWPDFPYAHYNRGSILWAVGACEDARQEYAIARFGDPALPGPHGECIEQIGVAGQ